MRAKPNPAAQATTPADYCEWPQVEVGHAIRELERAPKLIHWRERLGQTLNICAIRLSDDPSVILSADGRIEVDGLDAAGWECQYLVPAAELVAAIDSLRDELTAALTSAERALS